MHHGVRIKDAALVTAAVLSHRYITDRFLPDKAIDLVDEAAAKLRTEIESMPTELDEVSRRVMQLEIEREALRKESDAASRDRLAKLEKELADLKAQQQELRARWEVEKQAIARLRSLKEEIEKAKVAIEQAQREYDLNRAAELKYGKLAQLERQLADEEKRLHEQGNMQLLKEEVDEDDIAAVVARWTGIPVSRLLEGEKGKTAPAGRASAQARGRPGRSRGRCCRRGDPRPLRTQRSQPADRLVYFSRSHGSRQNRAGARPGRVHVR